MPTEILRAHVGDAAAQPSLLEVTTRRERPIELSNQLGWFGDLVGQLAEGFIYLLGGPPGSAKSKFATQLGVDLALRGSKVGVLLTEESDSRLRDRVSTLLSERPAKQVAAALSHMLVDDSLANIELLPEFVARQVLSPAGRFYGIRLLIIDSLMGHGLPATSGRKWERVFEGLRLCRQTGITVLAVAHLNKANAVGGPRTLTHNVDVVLSLRQLGNYRLMFAIKNRCGPTDARRPAKLVLNPVTLALEPAPLAQMQVVSAHGYLPGSGDVEAQAAVSLSLGSRRRIIGSNLPRGEIEQLLDTISQIPGVELNDLDFSVSCRLPGARMYWPPMGLALCLALIGSALQRPVPANNIHIGEVDLQRRIRDVPESLALELYGAIEQGLFARPVRILCSPGTAQAIQPVDGVEVWPCENLDHAVLRTWPDLR